MNCWWVKHRNQILFSVANPSICKHFLLRCCLLFKWYSSEMNRKSTLEDMIYFRNIFWEFQENSRHIKSSLWFQGLLGACCFTVSTKNCTLNWAKLLYQKCVKGEFFSSIAGAQSPPDVCISTSVYAMWRIQNPVVEFSTCVTTNL